MKKELATKKPEQTKNQKVEAQTEDQSQKKDVLGIISIVMAVCGFTIPGFVVGLVGSSQAKKENRPKILSRIGWILNLALLMFFASLMLLLVYAVKNHTSSNPSKVNSDINAISEDLEKYNKAHGHYPSELQQLKTDNPNSKWSLVDPDGRNYLYRAYPLGCENNCTGYGLSTADDSVNIETAPSKGPELPVSESL